MFKPLHMGTNHMLGIDSYVPLMKHNFEVRIYDNNGDAIQSYDYLTLSTDSVGAISQDHGVITVNYGNGVVKFPDKISYPDSVNWDLNCFCSPNVLDVLRGWMAQIYDPITEKMGLPSQYMKQVYFIKYDGQGNPRDVIKCPGTWITNLNNGDSTQSGGLVQVSVSFVISRAIYLNPSADNKSLTATFNDVI